MLRCSPQAVRPCSLSGGILSMAGRFRRRPAPSAKRTPTISMLVSRWCRANAIRPLRGESLRTARRFLSGRPDQVRRGKGATPYRPCLRHGGRYDGGQQKPGFRVHPLAQAIRPPACGMNATPVRGRRNPPFSDRVVGLRPPPAPLGKRGFPRAEARVRRPLVHGPSRLFIPAGSARWRETQRLRT